MTIRLISAEDITQSLGLLNEFKAESLAEYGINLDAEFIQEECKKYLAYTLVIEHEGKIVGILAGNITHFPLCGSKVYQEHAWYVSKKYRLWGLKLLKELERRCREWGVTHIALAHMANLNADKLDKFYRERGFVPYEINYIKRIEEDKA